MKEITAAICKECGLPLRYEIIERPWNGQRALVVEPCECCLEEAEVLAEETLEATPPHDAAVREAVEFFAVMDNDCVDQPDEVKRQAEILCRAVQQPRLTGEAASLLREIDTYFERMDTNGFRNGLRLHWPEAFGAGEVGRGE